MVDNSLVLPILVTFLSQGLGVKRRRLMQHRRVQYNKYKLTWINIKGVNFIYIVFKQLYEIV